MKKELETHLKAWAWRWGSGSIAGANVRRTKERIMKKFRGSEGKPVRVRLVPETDYLAMRKVWSENL